MNVEMSGERSMGSVESHGVFECLLGVDAW